MTKPHTPAEAAPKFFPETAASASFFYLKSEVWLLQTCPAIALGDGGWSDTSDKSDLSDGIAGVQYTS